MEKVNPPHWKRPKGYANAVSARGRMVFVAGQIGWTGNEEFETDDLVGQVRQALQNTVEVLKEAGAGPEHVARQTWYVVNKREYLDSVQEIGQVYREIMGKNFAAMSLIQVADLLEDRAKVEIESTAVVPD